MNGNISLREGKVYLFKIVMTTKKGKENGYRFMKVTSYVSFVKDREERETRIRDYVDRRVRFYQALYKVRIIDFSYEIISTTDVTFLPRPYFERGQDEQEV